MINSAHTARCGTKGKNDRTSRTNYQPNSVDSIAERTKTRNYVRLQSAYDSTRNRSKCLQATNRRQSRLENRSWLKRSPRGSRSRGIPTRPSRLRPPRSPLEIGGNSYLFLFNFLRKNKKSYQPKTACRYRVMSDPTTKLTYVRKNHRTKGNKMKCEKCGETEGMFYATNSGVICYTCDLIRTAFIKGLTTHRQSPRKYDN